VIGQKGVTINDLQRRSGCDIQINQDVPIGHDCQIMIRGTRPAIDSTTTMLREIIEMGPCHPYAGGRGQDNGRPNPHAAGYQGRADGYASQHYQAPSQSYVAPYAQQYQAPVALQQSYQAPYQAPYQGGYVAPPPPPMVWKTATAADGQTYYYNESTGETQWDKPSGM